MTVCRPATHTLGTLPIISSSLKQTCVLLPSPFSFGDNIVRYTPLSGSRGRRLPLHNSEEPLVRERQMCLYCKQERRDGVVQRRAKRILSGCQGGLQRQASWKNMDRNSVVCESTTMHVYVNLRRCLPRTRLRTRQTESHQLCSSLHKANNLLGDSKEFFQLQSNWQPFEKSE